MNANLTLLTDTAQIELGTFFDCPVNSKAHLMLVVAPWLKDKLMNQLCDNIDQKSSLELQNGVDWINDNLNNISQVIIDRLFQIK